jgi:hypothetical protein
MSNLPHDIISTAFKSRYSGSPQASLDHLFKRFSNNTSEKRKAELIKEILDALEVKGYLKWYVERRDSNKDNFKWDETFKLDFANSKRSYCFYDLKDTKITALLMPSGIDYAIDIDRKRVQHRTNLLAIVFAGLTTILTGVSLYKTIITQLDIDKKQQILQTTLQLQESLWRNTTNRLNQLIEKDSLRNSIKPSTAVLK